MGPIFYDKKTGRRIAKPVIRESHNRSKQWCSRCKMSGHTLETCVIAKMEEKEERNQLEKERHDQADRANDRHGTQRQDRGQQFEPQSHHQIQSEPTPVDSNTISSLDVNNKKRPWQGIATAMDHSIRYNKVKEESQSTNLIQSTLKRNRVLMDSNEPVGKPMEPPASSGVQQLGNQQNDRNHDRPIEKSSSIDKEARSAVERNEDPFSPEGKKTMNEEKEDETQNTAILSNHHDQKNIPVIIKSSSGEKDFRVGLDHGSSPENLSGGAVGTQDKYEEEDRQCHHPSEQAQTNSEKTGKPPEGCATEESNSPSRIPQSLATDRAQDETNRIQQQPLVPIRSPSSIGSTPSVVQRSHSVPQSSEPRLSTATPPPDDPKDPRLTGPTPQPRQEGNDGATKDHLDIKMPAESREQVPPLSHLKPAPVPSSVLSCSHPEHPRLSISSSSSSCFRPIPPLASKESDEGVQQQDPRLTSQTPPESVGDPRLEAPTPPPAAAALPTNDPNRVHIGTARKIAERQTSRSPPDFAQHAPAESQTITRPQPMRPTMVSTASDERIASTNGQNGTNNSGQNIQSVASQEAPMTHGIQSDNRGVPLSILATLRRDLHRMVNEASIETLEKVKQYMEAQEKSDSLRLRQGVVSEEEPMHDEQQQIEAKVAAFRSGPEAQSNLKDNNGKPSNSAPETVGKRHPLLSSKEAEQTFKTLHGNDFSESDDDSDDDQYTLTI